MREQEKIISTKIGRGAKFLATGAKVGGNYLKYYAKKTIQGNLDKTELHENNAEDIYNSLSQLKGSALKVAQMLSMDKNMLPRAYQDKFIMSQYQAPPLSGPLVVRTFQKEIGSTIEEVFDTFELKSFAAASIGQVHKATKGDQVFAVKVQYPGVGASIQSDLKMIKPIALRMYGFTELELSKYMLEVEEKLMEETDYRLEARRGTDISEKISIPGLFFPQYFPEYSSQKVLCMEWLDGQHLKDFLESNPSQEIRDSLGQKLWDFYQFQVHELQQIHADPHPGNFLFRKDGGLGVIDFGCIKIVPKDFYRYYFSLLIPEIRENKKIRDIILYDHEIIFEDDSAAVKHEIENAFLEMTSLLSRPFESNTFNFNDDNYLEEIYKMGESLQEISEIKKPTKARGSRHALYVNRTYFGLYNILGDLKANIHTQKRSWKKPLIDFWHSAENNHRL